MSGFGFKNMVDPVALSALYWGDPNLYEWQIKAMYSTWERGGQTAIVTPNEAGKTSVLVADIGLSFMAAYPGAQVVSTAGVYRQIEEQLWPVLRAKLSRYPNWKVNEGKITAPSQRGLPGSTWTAFSAIDPGKAEGYHGRTFRDCNGNSVYGPLLYIIDEAKSVDHGIFEAMGRCNADHVLVCSTPGEDTGPFFEIIDRKPVGWTVIEVSWTDCPHLLVGAKRRKIELEIAQFGENNPYILSKVFGKFTRAGGFFLFDDMSSVDECMSGKVLVDRSDKMGAVDLSGGGDEIVFGYREGNYCSFIEGFVERDAAVVADRLVALFRRCGLRGHQIIIDEGGLGDPIIDIITQKFERGIRRYAFNDTPRDRDKYKYRGAEDHFHLRRLVNDRIVSLCKDNKTREQARKRKYEIQDGLLWMEPKPKVRARGEPSPDRLDTLVMLFSNYLGGAIRRAREHKILRTEAGPEVRSRHRGYAGMLMG